MKKNILKLIRKKLPFHKKEQIISKGMKPYENKKNLLKTSIPIISDKEFKEFIQESENLILDKNSEKTKDYGPKKEKHFRPKKIQKQKTIQTNKNQIPIIDNEKNLEEAFKNPKFQQTGEKKVKPTPVKPKIKKKKTITSSLKNKHGIKIIRKASDLNDFFISTKEKKLIKHPADNERAFLNAKKQGAPQSKPISLEKRLSRYPLPELTLDLHGFTFIQAKLKLENFILSSFKEGYFTLKIITGKGKHSEFGAVIPQLTEDLVKEMINEKKVLAYKWENISMKASGSMVVYLNRFDN